LIVVRRSIKADTRLDAEVQIGGRLGPTEAVVMRMWGRLALHAESVVLPLLAPDAPVVTWWHGPPPEEIATDALGVLANRRVTDCAQAPDPFAALRQRASDFHGGDTDLAWTRSTTWRAMLASALDEVSSEPISASVEAESGNPSAALLRGWLVSKLVVETGITEGKGPGISSAQIVTRTEDGSDYPVTVERSDGRVARLKRGDEQPRDLPLARQGLGDLLAEELRRMDPDAVYAEALAAATGVEIEPDQQPRTLVWRDPAENHDAEDAEPAAS
jgi:glucose-6-phosphate dehydrogenase assembly protein OpcA